MRKAALHNLGCKVNAYETAAMQELLEGAGYEIVPFQERADVYIINTCTVTNIADRKSRQMLHRARKMNPDAVVVAAGCYVQAREEGHLAVDPSVDIVIGNNRKKDLVRILEDYLQDGAEEDGQMSRVIDINHTGEYEELHLTKPGEHTRAYIKVQDGCNQFCSYCIIPFARGRVRSRSLESVVEEVRELARNGYREVVLTGIHLSSYGADFREKTPDSEGPEVSGKILNREEHFHGGQEGTDLLALIRAVHEVDGILRIRLGSLEPRIITEEFVRTAAGLEKLCPHFHLSLQSGCDATLKRMNRRYTAAEYLEKCALLRKYFRNPALTTDVIVGFPGETEEEFAASMEFVDQVDFYETHIFKYSRREGTRAAAMADQVPEPVKAERSRRMIELGKRKQAAYERSFLGKEVEVLVEERMTEGGREYQVGHTREYLKIALEAEENLQNQIRKIRINEDLQIIH
nr:MiaB/RimO family radical SAM methylthiotransferase [uncultured Schaedlerella sp.]